MWYEDEYDLAKQDQFGHREWESRILRVWKALIEGGAMVLPADHQGPRFRRPHAYITAAITESSTTEEEEKRAVEAYCEYEDEEEEL